MTDLISKITEPIVGIVTLAGAALVGTVGYLIRVSRWRARVDVKLAHHEDELDKAEARFQEVLAEIRLCRQELTEQIRDLKADVDTRFAAHETNSRRLNDKISRDVRGLHNRIDQLIFEKGKPNAS